MSFPEKNISVSNFPKREVLNQMLAEGMVHTDFLCLGIKTIIPSYISSLNENCFDYVFGEAGYLKEFWNNFHLIIKFSEQESGAIAVYYNNDFLKLSNIKHVGFVNNDEKKVVSKWGKKGDVYLHEYSNVPLSYGDRVTFVENFWN
jgi:hypothetical protein